MSPLAATNVAGPRRAHPVWRAFKLYGTLAVICGVALYLTHKLFVEGPPPKQLVIASGAAEGAYYKFAQQYAKFLEKQKFTVEVRATKGSVENLQLLQDDNAGVDIAIVQGGVAGPAAAEKLTALGSLYREPLWVFHRGGKPVDSLAQLAGKRLAIGPPGSGTRAVAELLLNDNGVTAKDASFSESTGKHAADELEKGDIDAAFFVAAIEASYVQQLFRAKNVHLVSLSQQAAYDRRYHFLSPVTIPAGLVDLGRNIPAVETKLVAPTAMLVARKDLHPALVPLLLAAATQAHRHGDLISASNEFPSALYTDLPLDEDARHYYKSGPPVLQRFLPFWLATLVDRLKVMLIPIVMLMMPLFRLAPPLVRWRNRSKIYRWYNVVHHAEEKISHGITLEEVRVELEKLDAIDAQLPNLDVPLGYMGEFYTMRFHLRLVREKLEELLKIHENHRVQ